MTDPRNTTAQELVRACEIGSAEGLHFVYAGNQPGRVGAWENTRCPGCQQTLIERQGYLVRRYRLTAGGACPGCGRIIPGLWADPREVRAEPSPAYGDARLPRPVRLKR
jgi:pyruvate formate lyase activating enzyme